MSRRQSRKLAAPDADEAGPDADPHAVARAICLRLLTSRARTRSELATALRKRDVPEDVAASVLDRFGQLGFIDDEAFAHAWVASRQAGRGLAGRALAQELRQRGVADDVARAAIGTMDPDAETAKARELVGRRLAAMSSVPTEARYRRLTGMLARKGYPGALASRVVKEALAGHLPEQLDDGGVIEG
ncbi:MAG: regulatory protein RecX [Mycobacteriales bacterium]